jgi:flagellar biosynthesis protein FliR
VSLFNIGEEELLTFFMVLVRFSVLFSVLPFIGDRFIPTPAKILLALMASVVLFPVLIASKQISMGEANIWGRSVSGIVGTVAMEALFGLLLGYTARLLFQSISFGANLVGNFMGFASATLYDPHQESQTEVIAQIQASLAMLLFLVLDGHHLMLRASLDSYRIVGLGKVDFSASAMERLIHMTGQVFAFALQIAAPIAVSLFSVNVIFGVISKAMPQMNVLVLSMAMTALIGLIVLFLSMPGFQNMVENILSRIQDWMTAMMLAVGKGK